MREREKIVRLFCEKCVWVHGIRKHFAELYESGEDRRKLLSEISHDFFGDLNTVLREYLLLQQAKLTDPSNSGEGKENLTSNYLASLEWPAEVQMD